jgi:hypothetical protein
MKNEMDFDLLTMMYNTQNYWIFWELLACAKYMLHDMEIAIASFLGVPSA